MILHLIEMTGECMTKALSANIIGNGTKLVCKLVKSTLRTPSILSEAVIDE